MGAVEQLQLLRNATVGKHITARLTLANEPHDATVSVKKQRTIACAIAKSFMREYMRFCSLEKRHIVTEDALDSMPTLQAFLRGPGQQRGLQRGFFRNSQGTHFSHIFNDRNVLLCNVSP